MTAQIFKIEVQDDRGIWSDVRGSDGSILTFENENDARAKLRELYPVLVQMEKYGGGKRSRVVRVFRTDKEWKEGTPPT
jgi:predicted Ser/Thr protein kinase